MYDGIDVAFSSTETKLVSGPSEKKSRSSQETAVRVPNYDDQGADRWPAGYPMYGIEQASDYTQASFMQSGNPFASPVAVPQGRVTQASHQWPLASNHEGDLLSRVYISERHAMRITDRPSNTGTNLLPFKNFNRLISPIGM